MHLFARSALAVVLLMIASTAAWAQGYPDRPLTFIFGAMRDKAIGEMAEILFPLADRVIATRADNPF